jgi:hypothetical protein
MSFRKMLENCAYGDRGLSCEQGKGPSGSIKGEEFLESLSENYLLKRFRCTVLLFLICAAYPAHLVLSDLTISIHS